VKKLWKKYEELQDEIEAGFRGSGIRKRGKRFLRLAKKLIAVEKALRASGADV
jgi:hypothetical protein